MAKSKAPHKKPVPRKKRASKAPAKRKDPTSGQSAPPIELSLDALNAKEKLVLAILNGKGSGVRDVISIADIAAECFMTEDQKRANSWTRNSLRRLVQGGLVEKADRGKYRVSVSARRRLARAA